MSSIIQRWNGMGHGTRRWIIALVILVLGFFALRITTGHLIDKKLKAAIPKLTDGLYSLEYESLRLNMVGGIVELKNLRLVLNEARMEDLYGHHKMFFNINVERARVEVRMAWAIVFDRKVEVESILVDKPQIELIRTNVPDDGLSKSSGDLYLLIAKVLQELKIDELKVLDGSLDYVQDLDEGSAVTRFPDISFAMSGVLLDSTSSFDKKRIYYTDDLELIVRDQRFELGDSIHEIAFAQLSLNTRTEEIRIENGYIRPMEHIAVDRVAQSHNIYRNDLPLMIFSGTDFKRAYSDNILHIEKILIQEPHYSGINKVVVVDKEPHVGPQNTVPDLLSALFKELYVDTFQVENGSFDLELLENKRSQVDHIDAQFLALKIDSNTKVARRMGFAYGDLYFKIEGQHLFSSNNDQIELGSLEINTKDSSLILKDVAILSVNATEQTEIRLGGLKLSGADVEALIERRELRADSLVMQRPQILLPATRPGVKKKQDLRKTLDAYAAIEPYLVLLEIGDVEVLNGRLEVVEGGPEHYEVGDFDIHLQHTRIDEHSVNKEDIFYSDRSSFSLKDVEVGLHGFAHTLVAKEIGVLGVEERVIVRDLYLQYEPEGQGPSVEQYDIEIPFFELRGANIKKLVYKKQFVLKSLVLHDPKVKVNVVDLEVNAEENPRKASGEKLSDLISELGIDRVDVRGVDLEFRKNGELQFQSVNAYIKAKAFKLDPRSITENRLMLSVNDMNYGFQELLVFIGHRKDELQIGNTNIDLADRKAIIENVRFSPVGSADGGSIEVNIPKITLNGYDPFIGRYTRDADLGHLIVHEPKITIRTVQQEKKDSAAFEMPVIPERLPSEGLFSLFDTVQASSFEVQGATIFFEQFGEKDTVLVEVKKADVALNDLFISTTNTFRSGRDLWTDGIMVDMDGIHTVIKDRTIDLGTFHLDSKAKKLALQDLAYHDGTSKDTIEMKLQLRSLSMEGFAVHDLLVDHDLRIEDILFEEPKIQYRNSKTIEKKLDVLNEEIEKAVKGEIDEFYLGVKDIGLREPGAEPEVVKERSPLLAESLDISSSGLNSVDIGTIRMNDGEVIIKKEFEYESEATHIFGLDLTIEGVVANDQLRASPSKPLFVSGLKLEMDAFQQPLAKGLEELHTGSISWDITNGDLQINDLSYHPTVDPDTYGKAKGKQIEVFDIDSVNISISGFDAYELFHSTGIKMDTLRVSDAHIEIFKDKRLPFPFQIKNIPSRNLINSDRLIDIRNVQLSNTYLKYSEYSEHATEPGMIFLTDLNANVENITNDTAKIREQRDLKFRSTSKMMGQGLLEWRMDFDLNLAYQSIFTSEIRLAPMSLDPLNSFVSPHDNIHFRSGRLDTLEMKIVADNNVAVGEMGFFYKKLKIDFLKPDAEREKSKNSLFKGLLANAVIKTGNQYKGKSKTHDVYAERNKSRSVINYVLKALMSGMMSTISPAGYKGKIKKVEDPVLREKLRQEGL